MSLYKWGEYTRTIEGEIQYDIRLDKPRQIGLASIALYKRLRELNDLYFSSDENQELHNALEELSSQMRLLIIGNTDASTAKFKDAAQYFLVTSPDTTSQEVVDLVNLCWEIVNNIQKGLEYADLLIDGTLAAGIYNVESSLDIQPFIEG
jgi:hypothetical protein